MNAEAITYQFVASWLVFLVVMIAIARTRVGYVAIYYGLLLVILLLVVTEYRQVGPLLNPLTIGELNTKLDIIGLGNNPDPVKRTV